MSTGTQAKPEKKLTPKQEMFCLEYLIDLNATQAAIRAGYSKKTAYSIGNENLSKPEISSRISELAAKRIERASKSADDVIKEIENVGFARLNKVVSFNESGLAFVMSSDEIDDATMAALESVEVTEIVGKKDGDNDMLKTKVKLHSKMSALNLLAKHHGLVNDKGEDAGTVNLVVNVIDYSKVKITEAEK